MSDREKEEIVMKWTGYLAVLLAIAAAVAFSGQ